MAPTLHSWPGLTLLSPGGDRAQRVGDVDVPPMASTCPEHSPAPAFLLLLPRASQAELISSWICPMIQAPWGIWGDTLSVGTRAWCSLKCLKPALGDSCCS